jgi:hypothetical protein
MASSSSTTRPCTTPLAFHSRSGSGRRPRQRSLRALVPEMAWRLPPAGWLAALALAARSLRQPEAGTLATGKGLRHDPMQDAVVAEDEQLAGVGLGGNTSSAPRFPS